MTAYKIFYGDNHNKFEFREFDRIYYTNKDKCIAIKEDIQEQFPDRIWKIFEFDLKEL